MKPELTAEEARVLGSLMEKSVTTPNQYPMTLNALTNACNQKSARNPVMAMDKGEVQRTVRVLDDKNLVRIEENFKSGVDKYYQRLCNSRYGQYQFEAPEFAIICLLLLRGPQTPGELRTNGGRLHSFEDNAAVVAALQTLIEHEDGALVVKLPRSPGRKDSEYMHLLSGAVDVEAYTQAAKSDKPRSASRTSVSELEERLSKLEIAVAELRTKIGD